MTERTTPQSHESERAVLGGLIVDPDRYDDVAALVSAADFHRPDHARLFMLLRDMRAAGDLIDLLTVADRVQLAGHERYGGLGYVLALPDAIPSTSAIASYARTVRDRAERRRLIRALEDGLERAYEAHTVAEARAFVASAVTAGGDEDGGEWVSYDDAAADAVERAREAGKPDARPNGAWNPLRSWEKVIPTFERGEVHIIAARPGVGKSALARSIVEINGDNGQGTNEVVAVFSLEMSAEQIARLSLATFSEVAIGDIRAGRLDQGEWRRLEDARGYVGRMAVMVSRKRDLSIEDITTRTHALARRLARDGKRLSLVVIDYIQIIKRPPGADANAITAAQSRALKLLAVGLDVPVIALSQLSRDIEKRGHGGDPLDVVPRNSDLRDSGALEQDAATITFVVRALPTDAGFDPDRHTHAAKLHVTKHRYGAPQVVDVRFDGPTTTFSDPVSMPPGGLRVIE